MKKSKVIILFFILVFSLFISQKTLAGTISRAIIKNTCNVRVGPGTQNKKIASAYQGGSYNLVTDTKYEDTNHNKKCNGSWYHIYFNGTSSGYICEDHADIVVSYDTDDVLPSTECEIRFNEAGFPSSYWGGLCYLSEKHPNWEFVAQKVAKLWPEIIELESGCSQNLIYDNNNNEGFIDRSCEKFANGYIGVLPLGVAYYMDPRNFLAERPIFQFQILRYDLNFQDSYLEGINSILNGAPFYVYHGGNETKKFKYQEQENLTFNELINSIGLTIGVSPIFMSTRMLQELGHHETLYNLYSGIYEGYENAYYGYYNFYNYGVNDTCVKQNNTTYCGLDYAKKKEWNSVEKAVAGGISTISRSYINANQHTLYYQKFNVIGKNLWHQYQTNITAPSSESAITYNSFKKLNILDKKYTFEIPVFIDMHMPIDNSPNGTIIDDEVNDNVSSLPISTIVTSSGYYYSPKYISNIPPLTAASLVKESLESVGGTNTVKITDKSGNEVTEGILGTGFKISINNKDTTEVLEVVIKGDPSSDGVINALDLLQVQKNILGMYELTGASKEAGDTSRDGIINALDLLQIQKNILGIYAVN